MTALHDGVTSAAYHLQELQIARDTRARGHIMPELGTDVRRILDVGCGAGQTLIAGGLPPHARAIGLDVDFAALQLGKTLTNRVGFVCATGKSLPFCDAYFDVAISRVALPYMNLENAVRELARVLKPGGQV